MFPTILRGLGIKVNDNTAKMLETMLPQLPAKVNELIQYVVKRCDDVDVRLRAIELELNIIKENLEVASHGIDIRSTTDPGIGTGIITRTINGFDCD